MKFPSIFWFPSQNLGETMNMAIFCWEKTGVSGVKPLRFRASSACGVSARTNGGGLIELSAEELLAEDEEAMGRWGFGGTFDGKIPMI